MICYYSYPFLILILKAATASYCYFETASANYHDSHAGSILVLKLTLAPDYMTAVATADSLLPKNTDLAKKRRNSNHTISPNNQKLCIRLEKQHRG